MNVDHLTRKRNVLNLTFNGKPIDPNAAFLVATNNYRAYGGKFTGTGDSHIAFASPDENRSVLAAGLVLRQKAMPVKFARRRM